MTNKYLLASSDASIPLEITTNIAPQVSIPYDTLESIYVKLGNLDASVVDTLVAYKVGYVLLPYGLTDEEVKETLEFMEPSGIVTLYQNGFNWGGLKLEDGEIKVFPKCHGMVPVGTRQVLMYHSRHRKITDREIAKEIGATPMYLDHEVGLNEFVNGVMRPRSHDPEGKGSFDNLVKLISDIGVYGVCVNLTRPYGIDIVDIFCKIEGLVVYAVDKDGEIEIHSDDQVPQEPTINYDNHKPVGVTPMKQILLYGTGGSLYPKNVSHKDIVKHTGMLPSMIADELITDLVNKAIKDGPSKPISPVLLSIIANTSIEGVLVDLSVDKWIRVVEVFQRIHEFKIYILTMEGVIETVPHVKTGTYLDCRFVGDMGTLPPQRVIITQIDVRKIHDLIDLLPKDPIVADTREQITQEIMGVIYAYGTDSVLVNLENLYSWRLAIILMGRGIKVFSNEGHTLKELTDLNQIGAFGQPIDRHQGPFMSNGYNKFLLQAGKQFQPQQGYVPPHSPGMGGESLYHPFNPNPQHGSNFVIDNWLKTGHTVKLTLDGRSIIAVDNDGNVVAATSYRS